MTKGKLPKFTHEYEREAKNIFNAALRTMGEDLNFVLWRLSKSYKWKTLDLHNPTITEWIEICNLLYLDLSSFQYGYCKKIHEVHIWKAVQKGRYYFRMTPEIESIIDQMYLEEENNWKWQVKHSGDPLKSRLIKRWLKARANGYISKKQPNAFNHIIKMYQTFNKQKEISFHEFEDGKYRIVTNKDAMDLSPEALPNNIQTNFEPEDLFSPFSAF